MVHRCLLRQKQVFGYPCCIILAWTFKKFQYFFYINNMNIFSLTIFSPIEIYKQVWWKQGLSPCFFLFCFTMCKKPSFFCSHVNSACARTKLCLQWLLCNPIWAIVSAQASCEPERALSTYSVSDPVLPFFYCTTPSTVIAQLSNANINGLCIHANSKSRHLNTRGY